MTLRNINRDEILGAIGLESKRGPFDIVAPAIGIFAAGLLVGCGLGLLFAPKPGNELRSEIGNRVNDLRERLPGQVNEKLESIGRRVEDFNESLGASVGTGIGQGIGTRGRVES